jgi:hypothetical protein
MPCSGYLPDVVGWRRLVLPNMGMVTPPQRQSLLVSGIVFSNT